MIRDKKRFQGEGDDVIFTRDGKQINLCEEIEKSLALMSPEERERWKADVRKAFETPRIMEGLQ
jgi:hypothetical protein